jgi:flagellar hook-associated protein 3 FlgL
MISGTRYRLTMEINRQSAIARDIERAQVEISTEKRIQAPSDDPVGAARVSDIARSQANEGRWKQNLDFAFTLSARADTALGATAGAIDRANELMVAAANGTLSAQNRATIALELRSIVEELVTLKNSKDPRGDPLFPTGNVLRIPVGDGITIAAASTSDAVFSATTAGGPRDLAAIVAAAADAIEEPDPTLRAAAVGTSLDELRAAADHVSAARGDQGARGNRIDQLLESLASSGLQLSEERGAIEATNMVEVVARLQARQLTLQAAQAVFARINQSTLFDILR